ncbi:MAG: LpxL/LpxP family acyltransferase [Caulobacteraceae bacterium]
MTLPRRALAHFSDLLRVLAFLVLWLAAHLPRRQAFGAAGAIGALYAASPMGMRARHSMSAAFPGRDANKLARAWLTRPFRDFVSTTRIIARREVASRWHVESRNLPAILVEPGQSVIVATGHFSREAMTGLYMTRTISKNLAAVIAGLDRRSLKPRALRLRIQLGEMMEAIKVVRDNERVEIVEVGTPGVVSHLVKQLKRADTVVILATDSVAGGGRERGHVRPFAGHPKVSFALGTARLARLSQRPIVTCVPFTNGDNSVVLEWGEPIPAPARDDELADERITGAILDVFERAVGKRPDEYVLPIGDQRHWDNESQSWVPQ